MNESDALASLLGKTQPPGQSQPAAAPPATAQPAAQSAAKSAATPQPGGRRFWILIALGVLTCSAWIYGTIITLDRAIVAGRFGAHLSNGQIDLYANLIVFGGLLLIAAGLIRLMPVASVTDRLSPPLAFAAGIALGLSGMLLAVLQAWIGNHIMAGPGAVAAVTGGIALGSATTLLGAMVEEVVFRGWLQRRLALRISPPAAIVVGAIAFSALHVFGGARAPLALLNIVLAGVFFGLLLQRSGTLWCSIGAHFAWNWTEVDLLGLHPNPGTPPNGSVFDLELAGSAMWGGSVEGLNASLPVTVVMLALILPLLAAGTQREPHLAPSPVA